MRSSALDNLGQDYIRLARAKGLSQRAVLYRHLLRNACLPMITLVGLSIPALLAGNLLIEVLFNYQGLGLLFYNALQNEDYPVLLAYTVLGGHPHRARQPDGRHRHHRRRPDGFALTDDAPCPVQPGRPAARRRRQPPADARAEGGEVQVIASGWRLALREFSANRLAVLGRGGPRVLRAVLLRRAARLPHQPDR